jgi:hypothetical protein
LGFEPQVHFFRPESAFEKYLIAVCRTDGGKVAIFLHRICDTFFFPFRAVNVVDQIVPNAYPVLENDLHATNARYTFVIQSIDPIPIGLEAISGQELDAEFLLEIEGPCFQTYLAIGKTTCLRQVMTFHFWMERANLRSPQFGKH